MYGFSKLCLAKNAMIEIQNIMQYSQFKTHLNLFYLYRIGNTKMFYKKYIEGHNKGSLKLKCVPTNYYAQTYKWLHNKELHDYDLLAYFEGRLYKMLEPLEL